MKRLRRIWMGLYEAIRSIRLTLPVAITIAAIAFSLSFYGVQMNKSISIEKQQQIELEARTEKENREYIAKRKSDCLTVYKTESDKWNNVVGWNYVEPSSNIFDTPGDICEIEYKNSKYNEVICEEKIKATYDYKNNTEYKLNMTALITECNQTFTKSF